MKHRPTLDMKQSDIKYDELYNYNHNHDPNLFMQRI